MKTVSRTDTIKNSSRLSVRRINTTFIRPERVSAILSLQAVYLDLTCDSKKNFNISENRKNKINIRNHIKDTAVYKGLPTSEYYYFSDIDLGKLSNLPKLSNINNSNTLTKSKTINKNDDSDKSDKSDNSNSNNIIVFTFIFITLLIIGSLLYFKGYFKKK